MQQLNSSNFNKVTHPVRIVQFGEGNFLRCFIDWMVHQMNERINYNSGVAVVQPIPDGKTSVLNEQDGLYTVRLKGTMEGNSRITHEIIHSISKAVDPYTSYGEYIEVARNPDLRLLISNTTEAGITYADGQSISDTPPSAYPAKVCQFLYSRFQHFEGDRSKGLVLMPCELIDRNGDKLKNLVLRYATEWELPSEYLHWVDDSCVFCNSLVDRIVPGYPGEQVEEIWRELNYADRLIVEGELFHLLAIEAPPQVEAVFPAPSAGLNVVYTDNLQRYRDRKVRILNGAHIAMVPIGLLMGIQTVSEAVADNILGHFIREFVELEVIPSMHDTHEELREYGASIFERFENPYIKHFLSSIALNAVSKFGTRVAPTIIEYHAVHDKLPVRSVIALAALIRFYGGNTGTEMPVNDNGQVLEYMSQEWSNLKLGEIDAMELTRRVLGRSEIWGINLEIVPGLARATGNVLDQILDSPESVLQRLLVQNNIGGQ